MSIKHELKSMIISAVQKETDDSCAEPFLTRTLKTKPEMLYMWITAFVIAKKPPLCSDWIWFRWATSNYFQQAERTRSNPELSADGDRHGGLFHIHHSNCISWILKLKNMVLIHSPYKKKSSSFIHQQNILRTSILHFNSTVTIKTSHCDTPYNNQFKRSRIPFCPPDGVICTRRGEGV